MRTDRQNTTPSSISWELYLFSFSACWQNKDMENEKKKALSSWWVQLYQTRNERHEKQFHEQEKTCWYFVTCQITGWQIHKHWVKKKIENRGQPADNMKLLCRQSISQRPIGAPVCLAMSQSTILYCLVALTTYYSHTVHGFASLQWLPSWQINFGQCTKTKSRKNTTYEILILWRLNKVS